MTDDTEVAVHPVHQQLEHAVYRSTSPDRLAHDLGIRSLSLLIKMVLDEHYPADAFGDGSILYPSWASEHGGEDFDPGVRWVALLRKALAEVPGLPDR